MSIDDDVALLERVPTLRLLGDTALRVLAIGSEQLEFTRGAVLFGGSLIHFDDVAEACEVHSRLQARKM